jgi:hypothetical protein
MKADNALLTLVMTGKQLMYVLEQVVSGDGPCCELAGARVRYDSTAKQYERIRDVRLTGNRSVDGGRKYRVAISAALVEGGVFTLGAAECKPGKGCKTDGGLNHFTVEKSEHLSASVLRDYLRALAQPIEPPSDARLIAR